MGPDPRSGREVRRAAHPGIAAGNSGSVALVRPGAAAALDLRGRSVYVVVGALAVGLGWLAAERPRAAIMVAVGAVLLGVLVQSLLAGLCVFVALSFVEPLVGLPGGPSRYLGLLLALGWLGALAVDRAYGRSGRDLLARHPGLVATLALFVAWASASLLWAESSAVARERTIQFALTFLLFPIVFAAVRTPRQVIWLFGVFLAGVLLSAAIGLSSHEPSASGGYSRLSGVGLNPNQLGALLVAGAILAGALAGIRRLAAPARLAFLAVAGVCAAGVFLTGSRGALAGLVVGLAVAPLVAGRGRRGAALVLVLVAALSAYVSFRFVAPDEAAERIVRVDSSGSGRVDLWTIGWRMVEDKPLTGVGAGNFQVSSIHYLLRPGAILQDEYIVTRPTVPHNIYLNVLAELGVVGLALFVAALSLCLACVYRAALVAQRLGDQTVEALARGVLVAVVALLAAYFFSSQLLGKQLWLLLALAPALLAIARRREQDASA